MLDKTKLNEQGQTLLDAADLLEIKGWCQGQGANSLGNVCLVQAIWDAAASDASECEMRNLERCHTKYRTAKNAVADHLNIGRNCVVEWNDNPKRTINDVTDALRKTAYKIGYTNARQD